jgi:hypothetical protein
MLQIAASPRRPPGGTRVAQAEVQRRLRLVEEMMAAGKTRAEMVSLTGLPARTLDGYTKRVRGQWQEQAVTESLDARGRALDRLMALRERLLAAGAWGPLVSLERLIADVEGVRGSLAPSQEHPPERTLTEAPRVTAEWIRGRADMLINGCVSLARNSTDEELRGRVRQALSRGLIGLEGQESMMRENGGTSDP